MFGKHVTADCPKTERCEPAVCRTEVGGTDTKLNLTRIADEHGLWHMHYSETTISSERHVSLFRNGRNQAIRIPREFELEGTEAIIRKEGERLIIEPIAPRRRLLALSSGWTPLEEAFPEIANPPPRQEDVF